jgi:hypothetical protein
MALAIPTLTVDGTSTAIGVNHICVVSAPMSTGSFTSDWTGGRVICTGNGEFGKTSPPEVFNFVQIVAGVYFSCGLTAEQTVHCWGDIGQQKEEGMYLQISAGSHYVCGILVDGRLRCWGRARVVNIASPSEPSSPNQCETEYAQVSCGPEQLCALTKGGELHCFNSFGFVDSFGLIANGSHVYSGVGVPDLTAARFRQVSVGQDATCGITFPESYLLCWGSTDKHRIEFTSPPARYLQVSVSSGRLGVCAIHADRSLSCWGQAKSLVTFASSSRLWQQIEVGPSTVCAVSVASELKCGGGNGIKMSFPKSLVVA